VDEVHYGPVEVYLIGFSGAHPGAAVLEAIISLVQKDTVRIIDLLFVSRGENGELTVLELDEVADQYGLNELAVVEIGLVGTEDVEDLAVSIAPGSSAAVLVVEHVWAREFTEALYNAGGHVLQTERIPAPVVNELIASLNASV
jgi:uncharacterized membrane protein